MKAFFTLYDLVFGAKIKKYQTIETIILQRYSEEAFETDKLENHTVYYHRVGTTQDEDVLVFNDVENPLHRFYAEVSDDGKFLLIDILLDTEDSALLVADLDKVGKIKGRIQFKTIVSDLEAEYKVFQGFLIKFIGLNYYKTSILQYVANIGSKIILRTNNNAPNFQLVSFEFDTYMENMFSTFIKVFSIYRNIIPKTFNSTFSI